MKYFLTAIFWLLVTLPLYPLQTYKEIEVIKAPQVCLEAGNEHYCADSPKTLLWAIKQADTVKDTKETVKPRISQNFDNSGAFQAVVTYYNRASSCHYPKIVNGKRLCLTAIGRDTEEGRTVACPRNIKLGTKIMLNGRQYVCEDRYNSNLDASRGLPTIDVFFEDGNSPRSSRYLAQVTIIK